MNVFLCDCTLVSLGQLVKTFYVPPHNHSPWWGHNNHWNVLLTGTYDFLGMNYYTSEMGEDGVVGGTPSKGKDMGAILTKDPSWPESASEWLRVRTFTYSCVHPHIYLFLLHKSNFLPLNHTRRLPFLPLFVFRSSVYCTSKENILWLASSH
jgi:hypothetical protein